MHKKVGADCAQSPEPRAQSPEPRAQSPEPRAQRIFLNQIILSIPFKGFRFLDNKLFLLAFFGVLINSEIFGQILIESSYMALSNYRDGANTELCAIFLEIFYKILEKNY
jgi:hypothetical protein